MNWDTLYRMQKDLDQYIEEQHDLPTAGMIEEKELAFLVEVGELANETRCFKFWSTKKANEKHVILEEYVDGIHFLLSLGLDLGYRYGQAEIKSHPSQTQAFLVVYSMMEEFSREKKGTTYQKLFHSYLELGNTLGFTEEDLIKAYQSKNEVNFTRQNEGY